MTKAKKH